MKKIILESFFIGLLILGLGGLLWAAAILPTITVDLRTSGHAISPLLFGDGNEWDQCQDLVQIDTTQVTAGQLRSEDIPLLKPLGLKILRYPGGGISQFFHWEQSTGPWQSRAPQVTNDSLTAGSTTQSLQIPFFGPDEASQVAQDLGADMVTVVNIVTGTPSEAAAWLAYYKSKGVKAHYWEIGNEPYLSGTDASTLLARKTALQYAALFDSFSTALRAVDPTVQVGMVGCHDNPNSPAPVCNEANWNQVALSHIQNKVDFMAIHNSYAPVYQPIVDTTTGYQALLSAPQFIRSNLSLQEADIKTYANAASVGMPIAITETSAFWLPTADPSTEVQSLLRNFSVGSALFSALLLNTFVSDASIQMAVHHNLTSPYWQAALTTAAKNLTYPVGYQPNAVLSAYYYVLQLYSASASGIYLPAAVTNSPTFDAGALGSVPVETGVPDLDAIAVQSASPVGQIYIYVVNRSLTQDILTNVQVVGLNQPVSAVSAVQVRGADITSYNLPSVDGTLFNIPANPTAVQPSNIGIPSSSNLQITFPAQSLTRLNIGQPQSPGVNLNGIQIFPNPLRPAIGESQMFFTQLPVGAHLQIYTLAGEKVRDLTSDSTGSAAWDGTNPSGQKTASGVYFILVQSGNDKKTYKVAIQR